jgi:hypothetical protein
VLPKVGHYPRFEDPAAFCRRHQPVPGGRQLTELIEIRGALENNLKDVSLSIPKRKITIFTGVSGSGKSSIVFDTITTEAQRQLYENFTMFIRSFLPRYPQPEGRCDREPEHGRDRRPEAARRRGSHSMVGTHRHLQPARRLLERLLVQRPAGHVPGVPRARQEGRRRRRRLPGNERPTAS